MVAGRLQNSTKGKRVPILVTALFVTVTLDLLATPVYLASVRTVESRTWITGFLYQVNDSSIVITPGVLKNQVKAIGSQPMITIPLRLIRSVSIRRVKTLARTLTETTLVYTASAIVTVSLIPRSPKIAVTAGIITGLGSLIGYSVLTVRVFSSSDHFFREKLEEYSIVKDARSISSAMARAGKR